MQKPATKKNTIIFFAFLSSLVLGGVLYVMNQPKDIIFTAAITLFVAVLWVTEALPIPATSVIPFAAFPLFGVISHTEAASSLGSHVIMLLMAAFMLSKALEKANLHKRFAIYMLRVTGSGSPLKVILGFMMTTAVLSMWISNTATILMMLPMAIAIINALDNPRFGVALILGIAYAASLGGVGTPIGTPPNIIFMSVYEETQGVEYSFIEWMKTGIPIVIVAIPVMALWLARGIKTVGNIDLPEPGHWTKAEKRVLAIFGTVALAWIFRPFWTAWLGITTISDSTIAVAGVVAMFLVNSGNDNGEVDAKGNNEKLLDWKTANDIPWGMLLLFAGGICIAKAFMASGLSVVMGTWLTGLSTLPVLLLMLCICLFVTFLTEITSNTATSTLLMPILAAAGLAVGVDPKLLMIPAAISASCAFMLPVATAPNAIAYSTEKFDIKTMAREGIVLNVLVAVVVTIVCYVTLGLSA
ncbi:MAG: sodium:dicarboxylate symporter [Alteromonas sp.]|jgi:sodium-dependent dicarboxylate transporter 2/3/5|uniref:SLC13/DASS family transporter n=1 Tax=Alteromonas australica TaxID=589873 RepID=A0A075P0L2_9ALTE|nr:MULTISPECIES: SLC13 family permease [Alteromonas]MAF69818.1 sodium:dicarboxylate symporter [Alteromonas sp.]AIF99318.1 sodium:dicarboxylate symporter [Alteromonas australica]MAO31399.1 sodium:dicarboxylate symporter [Alteromonas sp.]MBU34485.1 sodium:dicarboxylate symporter [Alteromonas sp.]QPL51407.1 SLC13/DASS family transporter [Alteromonas sp. B31-7]|tara:strand:- start:118 stop:1530 length:1413 start_codon:yes stop_codon:yes gene_type:complete